MYEWEIIGMQTLDTPQPETIVHTRFRVSKGGQAVEYSVGIAPPAAGEPFAPMAGVTHEMAIGWTRAALGPERVHAMEAEVDAKVANAAVTTPAPVEKLPWVAAAEAVEAAAAAKAQAEGEEAAVPKAPRPKSTKA